MAFFWQEVSEVLGGTRAQAGTDTGFGDLGFEVSGPRWLPGWHSTTAAAAAANVANDHSNSPNHKDHNIHKVYENLETESSFDNH